MPTPNCPVSADPTSTVAPDPALAAAVEAARAAAVEEAGGEPVGTHVGVLPEDGAATHLFEANVPGYRGWRWAVTVANAGADTQVTVSEVVLLPGPDALTAPNWVPWQHRVQAGDLGVGDLLPTDPGDVRLVPAYLASDDEAVEEEVTELGLGRVRVMSRIGRYEAADRWLTSDYGPDSDMARSAPAHCGTCGFYLPVAGSLRAAFGVCGNEFSPADGRIVHVEYGCGAHSEVELDSSSPIPVSELVYDDTTLDVEQTERAEPVAEPEPAAEPEPVAEAEPVATVEPAADAEPASEPETEAEPGADAEPVAEAEPAAEPEAEPAEVLEVAEVTEVAEPEVEAAAPEAETEAAVETEAVETGVVEAEATVPETEAVAAEAVHDDVAEDNEAAEDDAVDGETVDSGAEAAAVEPSAEF
ncbi:MAG TPA: DUF3027 domain-containing protein [Pseudonocardiaceae bacterium]|jgi:hypothetical protein|nr:DUF3027 domain-containing protein [Pseudonocardiaceae bacterium]